MVFFVQRWTAVSGGSYHEHVRQMWERRNHPNLHIVFYEDLEANILKELLKLNDFLDTGLTEDQLKKVEIPKPEEISL